MTNYNLFLVPILFIMGLSIVPARAQSNGAMTNEFSYSLETGANTCPFGDIKYSSAGFLTVTSYSSSPKWNFGLCLGGRQLLDTSSSVILSKDVLVGYSIEYIPKVLGIELQQTFSVFSGSKKGRLESTAYYKLYHPKARTSYLKAGIGYSSPYSEAKGFIYMSVGIGLRFFKHQ